MSRLAVGIVGVVLLLTVAAGSAAAASIDRPTWTTGDFWTYRVNNTLTPGFNLSGEVTSTVAGTLSAPSGASPAGAFRIVLTGSGTAAGTISTRNGTLSVQGAWTLIAEEHYEPDNLQLVYSLLDLSVNGTYGHLIPLPFSLRFQNTTTFRILTSGWRYPLATGNSGITAVDYNFTQDVYSPEAGSFHENGTGESNLTFLVSDSTSVDVSGGAVTAYPIAEGLLGGGVERGLYAPTVGNDVRIEEYGADGNLTSVSSLVAYRYQAAEPATFLGLTFPQWGLVIAAAVGASIAILLLLRRFRRRTRILPREGETLTDATSGPRGP